MAPFLERTHSSMDQELVIRATLLNTVPIVNYYIGLYYRFDTNTPPGFLKKLITYIHSAMYAPNVLSMIWAIEFFRLLHHKGDEFNCSVCHNADASSPFFGHSLTSSSTMRPAASLPLTFFDFTQPSNSPPLHPVRHTFYGKAHEHKQFL